MRRDWPLVIRTTVLLSTISVGLRLLPYKSLEKFLRRVSRKTYREDRVAWAVGAMSRRIPGAGSCLPRALAAACLTGGEVKFGVRHGADGVEAHAWTVAKDRVVINGPIADWQTLSG